MVSSGGDLEEAYLAGDDSNLYRVRAGRPLRLDRLDSIRGAGPFQAALVPAPRLTSFAGGRTVLVVKGADGSLFGFQSGRQIWREGVPQDADLRRLGAVAVLGYEGSWSLVAPESGLLTPLASECPDGPLAEVQGSVVFACSATTQPGASLTLPSGPAFDLRTAHRDESVLAYPSGDWFRIDHGPRIAGQGHGSGGEGRPGLSPDGAASTLNSLSAHVPLNERPGPPQGRFGSVKYSNRSAVTPASFVAALKVTVNLVGA